VECAKWRFNRPDEDGSGETSLNEMKSCIQRMDSLVTTVGIEELLEMCDSDPMALSTLKIFSLR
jgi:Ca2+-binding EF-hand superfamily protein